nr:hypothetical protein [Rhodococcus sp. JVH1]
MIRLGQARLTRFLIARSRGAWRDDHAAGLITAARETLALWGTSDGSDGMDFAELAEDIAHEAEQALFLTRQIKQIDGESRTSTPTPTRPASLSLLPEWGR